MSYFSQSQWFSHFKNRLFSQKEKSDLKYVIMQNIRLIVLMVYIFLNFQTTVSNVSPTPAMHLQIGGHEINSCQRTPFFSTVHDY